MGSKGDPDANSTLPSVHLHRTRHKCHRSVPGSLQSIMYAATAPLPTGRYRAGRGPEGFRQPWPQAAAAAAVMRVSCNAGTLQHRHSMQHSAELAHRGIANSLQVASSVGWCSPAVAPSYLLKCLSIGAFALAGRVAQGEDDGAVIEGTHGINNLLVEGLGNCGHTHLRGKPQEHAAHHTCLKCRTAKTGKTPWSYHTAQQPFLLQWPEILMAHYIATC